MTYHGQQEEDEFRMVAVTQKRIEGKKAESYTTTELSVTREEAAARKKVTVNYYNVCL